VLALHRVGGEFWNTGALGAAVAFGHYDDRHPARPHHFAALRWLRPLENQIRRTPPL